jgi:hypothetical protein
MGCIYRVLLMCGDWGQLNLKVKWVLRIGVGGCSILGGGHRSCAVLVCFRRLFSGGADRGVSGHISVGVSETF